ncbi:Yip1 family protein [Pseudoclostridium thermosuccinogenes]|uniref:Yip1 family protein n=1 Tax=Clostridium thermosuccinogenes TaxID=84032 RepID=UPI002FD8F213
MINKEKFKYPFYVMVHPFDGFYEIRHRGKGSVFVALLLVLLFGLSFSINRRYASFVVNYVNPLSVDSRAEIAGIFFAVLLLAVSNWSITCLMEGEGRFKDILTVIGYSLLPMVLTLIPATILSWFVASSEEGLYYLIITIATIFTVILVVIGIMTIHNYTFGKTIATLFLSFIALLIIIFIILLLIYLLQQVFMFFQSLYTEVILKI